MKNYPRTTLTTKNKTTPIPATLVIRGIIFKIADDPESPTAVASALAVVVASIIIGMTRRKATSIPNMRIIAPNRCICMIIFSLLIYFLNFRILAMKNKS